MLNQFSAIGFWLAAMLIVGGCVATKTGLEVEERGAMLPPQADAAVEEPGETESYDDLLVRVAQQVPAFGGMFFEFVGREYTGVLYVYLLDPAQKEAAAKAIMTVFGPYHRDLLPPREIRVLQAQYSFLQLKEWFDLIGVLHSAIPEVTMTDIDDTKNRLTIGVLSLSTEVVTRIEQELARLGVPRNAVILEETGPFVEDKLDIARALDANRNGFLDDLEIMRGLDLWARQAPVPALGTVITDVQLLELLELWRSQQSLISEE